MHASVARLSLGVHKMLQELMFVCMKASPLKGFVVEVENVCAAQECILQLMLHFSGSILQGVLHIIDEPMERVPS